MQAEGVDYTRKRECVVSLLWRSRWDEDEVFLGVPKKFW